MLTVRSFNILAQGFSGPFWYVDRDDLSWVKRRERILVSLTAHTAVGCAPSFICVQELQSTSRGWGRLLSGVDGDDHAEWLRLKMASLGYEGLYAVNDDAASSSKSEPKNDARRGAGNSRGKDGPNLSWPTETDDGVGGRIGVAIFFKDADFELVATKTVSFSQHFKRLTKDVKNMAAWERLSSWCVAIVAVFASRATGALVCIANTHLPTPGAHDIESADDSAPKEEKKEDAKGVVQQVQFCEALCVEIASMLKLLRLDKHVPVIITGDLNALPGSPAHELLTRGALKSTAPSLTPRLKLRPPSPLHYSFNGRLVHPPSCN